MSISNINKKYHGSAWSIFEHYGLTQVPEAVLPSGSMHFANRTRGQNLSKGKAKPVIITVLEDQLGLLFNFLSNLDDFFRASTIPLISDIDNAEFQADDFAPGADVHVVWATSPEDLRTELYKLRKNLKKQCKDKFSESDSLNILDFCTNRIFNNSLVAAGQCKSQQGGKVALAYLRQIFTDSLKSLFCFQSLTRIGDINIANIVEVKAPYLWGHQAPLEQLTNLWQQRKIPLFPMKLATKEIINACVDVEQVKQMYNKPLIEMLRAFNAT